MLYEGLFDENVHPGILRFVEYCREISGGHALPRRSQFRPSKVPSIISLVFLIDVLPEQDDYGFSLLGDKIAVLYGADLRGARLSQVGDAELRSNLRRTYDRVVQTGTPLYRRGRYEWPDRSIRIERLLVPMTDDEGHITTIIGLTIPDIPTEALLVFAGQGPAKLVLDDAVPAAGPAAPAAGSR